jgi:putative DNA primase/helicase
LKNYPRLKLSQLDNFPEELKRLKQWVCWILFQNPAKEKPDKILIDPFDGVLASSTNSKSWASFEEACDFFEGHQRVGYLSKDWPVMGLGFVFSPEDPYTGIDIDDCREPQSGKLMPEAEFIVNALDSYTEASPSGTGVHIFVNASLPGVGGRRRSHVEMYSHGRYFTVSGQSLRVPRVERRQSQLIEVYNLIFGSDAPPVEKKSPQVDEPKLLRVRAIPDKELLDKMFAAANSTKFTELWEAKEIKDHSQSDASLCSILAYWTRCDEERIDKFFRQSKLMRKKWDEKRGPETYGQRTIRFSCGGTVAMYDPDMDATTQDPHNDIANVEILVQLHGSNFLYAKEWNSWLSWNCHHWEPNADLEILRSAEDVSKELLRRTNVIPDAKDRAKAAKWAISSGDDKRVNSMEKFARRRLFRSSYDFDYDPYMLCCENGVVDLRTGKLRDGTRADLITRSTGLRYDPDLKCPVWNRFLEEIMQFDEDMIAYLWRVIGYALTGDVTERAFFLFCGDGRNGKSTFVETLKALLGPPGKGYAQKARFSTFLKKSFQGGANDDVAHFAGARVIVASEADERMPLDVALVKELTGGDTHRARFLYGREFEFIPQFKLFLVTNKVPPIHETTYSIWDRLHYVPFEWRVPDDKIDKSLSLRLLGELPGILTKAVEHCIEWQQHGLCPPDKVLKAGERLYKDMDTCGQFFIDCCKEAPENRIKHKELYVAFTAWCKSSGINKAPSSKWLAAELRSKKYQAERMGGNVMYWQGIDLLSIGDIK